MTLNQGGSAGAGDAGSGAVPSGAPSGDGGAPSIQPVAQPDFGAAVEQAVLGQPATPQAQPQEPAQGDPLDELIPSLTEAQRTRIHALKTQAGRAAATARKLAELEAQRPQPQGLDGRTEALLIAAVQNQPNRLHEYAAAYGVDANALAQAAGVTSPGNGRTEPSWRDYADHPKLLEGVSRHFLERANPAHAESWMKPIMDMSTRARSDRMRAADMLARARVTESAVEAQEAREEAGRLSASADQLEHQAEVAKLRQIVAYINSATMGLHERLKHKEAMFERVEQQSASQAAQRRAWDGVVNEMRTAVGEDGSPTYAELGIFEVDGSGNLGEVSDLGRTILAFAHDQMVEMGIPITLQNGRPNTRGVEAALAWAWAQYEQTHPSDGTPAGAAGGQMGGDTVTLPVGSQAPGYVGVRPSSTGPAGRGIDSDY